MKNLLEKWYTKYGLTLYIDTNRPDGQQIEALFSNGQGWKYAKTVAIPMSGVPEAAFGVARFIGMEEIEDLAQQLETIFPQTA